MKRFVLGCVVVLAALAPMFASGPAAAVADPGWGSPVSLESNTLDAIFPEVAVDRFGNAMVAWRQFDGNIDNASSNYFEAGTGWGAETFIEFNDTGSSTRTDVAFDGQGNALSVWKHFDGTRSNLHAAWWHPTTGWGPEQVIDSDRKSV